MDNPDVSNRPQGPDSCSDDGRDWLATTGAGSAGAVLAALRDSSSGLGAPFAQPILLFERARVVGTLHIRDIDFICTFVGAMANAKHLPVKREMPEKMKEKLDNYLTRKRPKDA